VLPSLSLAAISPFVPLSLSPPPLLPTEPDGKTPSAFEEKISKGLLDLEASQQDISAKLRDLYFSAALQIEVPGGEQAIVLMVPFRLLKDYQEIHKRLVRELEKKFSGSHVVIIGERKMYAPNVTRRKNFKGPRPRSRTLTKVHEAWLTDMVYPTEIVGVRTKYKVDGSKEMKVLLDPKAQHDTDTKLDTFNSVYKQLTNKNVSFQYPITRQ
jgi:small subunit ribosomal protein S7e